MSTKINNGFILDDCDSISEAKQHVNSKADLVRSRAAKLARKAFTKSYFYYLDNVYGEITELAKPAYEQFIEDYEDAQRDIEGGIRRPDYDFEVIVTLKEHKGRVYGGIFCENPDLHSLTLKAINASSFPYWDNTDGPGDISREDWEKRGKLWQELICNHSWDKSGFSPITLCCNSDIPKPNSFSAMDFNAYTLRDRLKAFSIYRTTNYVIHHDNPGQSSKYRPSQYINALVDVKEGNHLDLIEGYERLFLHWKHDPTEDNFKTLLCLPGVAEPKPAE